VPQIELVPVPLYQPSQPYNSQIDNIPIQGLIDRILLVNSQVDVDATILSDAQGTQGTLSNRLAQSINEDGSLKTTAIDEAQHNIAEHTDGSVTVNGTLISYVRMLFSERAKLAEIGSDANNLEILVNVNNSVPSGLPSQISVVTISQIEYLNGVVEIKPSDSIYWSVEEDGSLKANTNFPSTVRHLHNYDVVPVPQNLLSPDYKNYVVTSTATQYRSGSLRVYINGIRLTQSSNITPGKAPRGNYVPISFSSGTPTWVTYTYTEDTASLSNGIITSGQFSLSSAITAQDVITVDFDMLYTG
jgi:hypothetical protein